MSKGFFKIVAQKAPSFPGVYFFIGHDNKPIYIGKAANIKKRLKSYFAKDAPLKVADILAETKKLKWIKTASEIEAIVKESELIKKFQPKFNTMLKSDVNFFFVGFTRENFPKMFITHQIDKFKIQNAKSPRPTAGAASGLARAVGTTAWRLGKITEAEYIGPFTSGTELKTALKILRRIFPYCTCRRPHKTHCLNAQLGRCPGFCCLQQKELKNKRQALDEKNEYQKNIKYLKSFLRGNTKKVISLLKKEIKEKIQTQNFEEAGKIKKQIWALENIGAHRNIIEARSKNQGLNTGKDRKILNLLQKTLELKNAPLRIEAYDISNLFGEEAVGSMIVFENGLPKKSDYRKFKIKKIIGIDDPAMMREVLLRRFNHPEWPYPDLILIDGGRTQLTAAASAIAATNVQKKMDIIGLAKYGSKSKMQNSKLKINEEEILMRDMQNELAYFANGKKSMRLKNLPKEVAFLLMRIRNEAHRFAITYHRRKKSKALFK